MAERYTRIYTLESAQYQNESPVIIAAGALLKDNKDESILAQLKFTSVSDKRIKALRILIQPLDINGEFLGTQFEYQYLDLSEKRDDQFGQKVPIRFSDNNTRKFMVKLIDAVYEDDSKWSADGSEPIIVSQPVSISDALNNDADLMEEFKSEYGSQSKYMPEIHESYWICSCGALNRSDETRCHSCSNEKSILLNIDVDELKEQKDIRKKEDAYNKAISLAKENTFDSLTKALSIMERLSGWKDSDEKAVEFEARIIELKKNIQKQPVELALPEEPLKKKKPNKIVLAIAAVVTLVLLIFGISKLAVSSQTIPVAGLVAKVDGEIQNFTVQEIRWIDWDITGNLVLYSNDTVSLDAEVLDENGKIIQSEHIEKASMIKDGSDYYDEDFTMIKYKLKKDGREVGMIVKYVPTDDGDPYYLVTTKGTYGFTFD